MKKLLSLALAAAMCLSLAACGNGGATPPSSQFTPSNSSDIGVIGGGDASTEIVTTDSDLEYVKNKGTLIVGITEFEPMDYQNSDGEWIGFDADLAKAFAESLGVEVKFQVIDWSNKVFELDGKTIDVVWNGMTLNNEVMSAMECSNPYFDNAQVVIVPADVADKYQTVESVQDLAFAVESGSAAQAQADEHNFTYTEVEDQATTLMEVNSGTSDASIIDYLMAKAMIGPGTGYENLTFTVSLNSEQYGVGFRKGSDMAAALNEFFKTSYADGTMQEIAETYNIADKLVAQ